MSKVKIGLSTIAYDIAGARMISVDQSSLVALNQGRRRATRTKTLDGGAVVYDAGYSVADQTFQLTARVTERYTGAYFAYLATTYNLIRVTTDRGVYTAVPVAWTEENAVAKLELMVMSQEA